jgi:hypothetical protein
MRPARPGVEADQVATSVRVVGRDRRFDRFAETTDRGPAQREFLDHFVHFGQQRAAAAAIPPSPVVEYSPRARRVFMHQSCDSQPALAKDRRIWCGAAITWSSARRPLDLETRHACRSALPASARDRSKRSRQPGRRLQGSSPAVAASDRLRLGRLERLTPA